MGESFIWGIQRWLAQRAALTIATFVSPVCLTKGGGPYVELFNLYWVNVIFKRYKVRWTSTLNLTKFSFFSAYLNRKGYASLNVLVAVDHEGFFTFVDATWPGTMLLRNILRSLQLFFFSVYPLQDILRKHLRNFFWVFAFSNWVDVECYSKRSDTLWFLWCFTSKNSTGEFHRLGRCFVDWAIAAVGEGDTCQLYVSFTRHRKKVTEKNQSAFVLQD